MKKEKILKILENPKNYIEYMTINEKYYIKLVYDSNNIVYLSENDFNKVVDELKKYDEVCLEPLCFTRIVYKLKRREK